MARSTTQKATADVAETISRLVRQEMRTVGQEMRAKAGQAGVGAGLLVVASTAALYAGGCAVAAFVTLLGRLLPTWLAAGITALLLAAVAGLAALLGVEEVRRALPLIPEQAAAEVAAAAQAAESTGD
jgi:hypothetical protein